MSAYIKPILVTDSCSDLSRDYCRANDIHVINLSFSIDNGDFAEDIGDEAQIKNLYEQLRQGKTSTTSQANVFSIKEEFLKIIKNYNVKENKRPILYLAFSSGLSGTCGSALIAREQLSEEYPDIEIKVFNTLAASLGEGLLVYYVAEMIKSEKSISEILDWLKTNALRLNHWFTVDDLNHLKRGGRVSGITAFVGTMLSIKPILWVNHEGYLKPVFKERGRKKAINALYDKFSELVEEPDGQMIFISHGDCYDEAVTLKEKIMANYKVKDVQLNYVGTVIGTHSGPGTIALFFLGKSRLETNELLTNK